MILIVTTSKDFLGQNLNKPQVKSDLNSRVAKRIWKPRYKTGNEAPVNKASIG